MGGCGTSKGLIEDRGKALERVAKEGDSPVLEILRLNLEVSQVLSDTRNPAGIRGGQALRLNTFAANSELVP